MIANSWFQIGANVRVHVTWKIDSFRAGNLVLDWWPFDLEKENCK